MRIFNLKSWLLMMLMCIGTGALADSLDEPKEGKIPITAKGVMPGIGGEDGLSIALTPYYATFSSDRDVIISGDLLAGAYIIYIDDEGQLVPLTPEEERSTAVIDGEEIEGYFVPAETGVMLISFENEATFHVIDDIYDEAHELHEIDPYGMNFLCPSSWDKTDFEGFMFYKLAYSDSSSKPASLGFYWGAANGGAFESREGSAYLAVPTDMLMAPKGGFRLFDDATGIKVMRNEECVMRNYNLNGQRVSPRNFKGIVVKNGRKILSK